MLPWWQWRSELIRTMVATDGLINGENGAIIQSNRWQISGSNEACNGGNGANSVGANSGYMTQSERSYTASYGRSVAATERAMTGMEKTMEESAYN